MWKTIEGFPRYEVSNAGEVRIVGGKLLKPFTYGRRGYLRVNLYGDGIVKTRNVSRLVLAAFVGPAPSSKHHAAHGNGDRSDNSLLNLRWATPKENEADKIAHGTAARGERVLTAKLTEETARAIIFGAVFYQRGEGLALRNAQELADKHGISKSQIRRTVWGGSWSHIKRSYTAKGGSYAA